MWNWLRRSWLGLFFGRDIRRRDEAIGKQRIPNESLPPRTKDLVQLPKWAQVAFGVRCVRRSFPSVRERLPSEAAQIKAAAIDFAERMASTADATIAAEASAHVASVIAGGGGEAAYAVAKAAEAAARGANYGIGDQALLDRCAVATQSVHAAQAAAFAASCTPRSFHEAVVKAAGALRAKPTATTLRDARIARAAAEAAGEAAFRFAVRPQWSDFRLLQERARLENWTEDTPVPQSVFGAMWPDGPPPGWPGVEVNPSKDSP